VRKILKVALLVLVALAAFAYVNNSTLFHSGTGGGPTLLAHRGLAQTFPHEGLQNDTCTATRMHVPVHGYLENTLPSMRAAFDLGADVVELDVHPTTDGALAVFHDWAVDCRTNGTGVTREHTLAQLKALDIGHGYTADNGASYPFRGKGVGLMPSLDEVLAAFPDRRLLIHIKGNDPEEGRRLAQRLAALPVQARGRLMVYGGARPVEIVRSETDIRTMSVPWEKQCLLRYLALGWSGHVPAQCARGVLLVPANYAVWLWGWPGKFIERMRSVGTDVFVLGNVRSDEGFSRGVDSEADLRSLPANFTGGIWTNRIDLLAPLIKR
jgi:glycerophosphoryl diester phosphodiesterase